MTRHAALFALALLLAAPAQAQETPRNPDIAEGAEMLSEGVKTLLKGLLRELEPAGEAAEQGWDDMLDWLGDFSAYDAPERLENGDILIRRKQPLPEETEL